MIWAFEYLTPNDLQELKHLSPLMGIRFDRRDHMIYWRTFCAGYDEAGVEIRRIRTFKLEQTRQGFICDDWFEAMDLSYSMQGGDFAEFGLLSKYPWLSDYYEPRKSIVWMKSIAMPVHEFIRHNEQSPALDDIDLDSLLRL